ncbi:MAG: hypothetical protein KJP14_04570 [Eudoraea sp.]|nr:hypothetical protein [Eudoraea sp.]MBT8222414.1 hypothetical protein [Eudoraea sp.]NNK70666.1 hypothetical protein [Flavobacteriaceae bacterium]
MKTIGRISVLLVFLVLCAWTVNTESNDDENLQTTFEVYSVHELEVKSNIDLKEFETYVLEEIAPIYNKMEGQHFSLVKGDRGMRTNKYAVVLTFDSLDDRNRIYPPSGELVGDFGSDAIWEKLDSMLDKGMGQAHTDYVTVSN